MEPVQNAEFTDLFRNGNDAMVSAECFEDIRKDLNNELRREEKSSSLQVILQQPNLISKKHMLVYLRIRPFTEPEIAQYESQDCIAIENLTSVILKAPRNSMSSRCNDRGIGQVAQRFTFSHVFGPETKQKEIFDGTVKPLIEEVMNRQKCLVFTYGVTNAGKTYTFQGPDHDVGILPRTMSVLFNSIQGKMYQKMNIKPQRSIDFCKLTETQVQQEEISKNAVLHLFRESDQCNGSNHQSSVDTTDRSLHNTFNIPVYFAEPPNKSERVQIDAPPNVVFSVWVSFFEIYNETIYDLLDPIPHKSQKRNMLRLVQDAKGNPYVKDLKWIQASNAEEAYKILKVGRKHQSIASTKINNLSSRSHCIFSIRVLHVEGSPLRVLRVSELSLCDLAGSERNAKTENDGDRLKEAGNINTSLLILGKCINALKHNQFSKTHNHVPFRESKLTRHFQGFFCGKGKACMIVNINQCASMFDETLNGLKFSAVAQKVLVDTSKCRPGLLFQKKSARDVSMIINNAENKTLQTKRETMAWDATLEDLPEVENEDDETESITDVKLNKEEEDYDGEDEREEEQEEEEESVVISKSKYEKLLYCIEDLKTKLIEEMKEKVTMEMKIREEAGREMENYIAQWEGHLSDRLKEDKQVMEDRTEKRFEIFQNLVKTLAAIDKDTAPGTETTTKPARHPENMVNIDVAEYIESLEPDVADIKRHAEMALHHITALPEPQDTIVILKAELSRAVEELHETQAALRNKTSELNLYRKSIEGLANQQLEEAEKNEEIQTLKAALTLNETDLNKMKSLSNYEERIEDYEKIIKNIQGIWEENRMIKDQHVESVQGLSAVNRKRPSKNCHEPEDQPPSKKGQFDKDVYNCTSMKILEKKVEELRRELSNKTIAVTTLNEKVKSLDGLLDLAKEDLQSESRSKERLSKEVEVLKLELTSSGQRIFKFTEEIMIQKSNFAELVSEVIFQKEMNEQQSEKTKLFQLELEFVKQDRADKELQIQMLEENIVKLSGFQTEVQECMVDLKNTNNALEEVKEESVKKTIKIESLQRQLSDLDQDLNQANAKAVKRDSTHFHQIIESMQKECEQIAILSSQTSQQNEELKQQIELLNKTKADLQSECTELKRNEAVIQTLLQEKSDHFQQLNAKLEETDCKLKAAVQASVQDNENHSELQNELKNHKRKIKEKDLEISKCQTNITRFEEQLKERESLIAHLQNNSKAMEEKLQESEKCIGNFRMLETNLRAEVQEIQGGLTMANEMLSEKTGELENTRLEIVQLKKDLSDNSSRSQILSVELQRKDDEYSDLKEKYMDTKKQIQLVEKEISTRCEEEKCVRHKIQELERVKNQMAQNLEAKERIIQQFKKACSSETDLQKKVASLTITLEEKIATVIKLEKDLEEHRTTHKEQRLTEGQEQNKDSSHYPNLKADIVLTNKTEEAVNFRQTTSKVLQEKEKMIQDLKIVLSEQEQTQTEQDEVLEKKMKEIEQLNTELEKWRLQINGLTEKYNKIEHCHLTQNKSEEYSKEVESFQKEIEVLKKHLMELEAKQKDDRQKYQAEKLVLIKQTKEAEDQRNKEMRKWAEEREHYSKSQESLTSELVQKDAKLQKWREERDNLVKELEVQLKNLMASNIQKDKEIERLKASGQRSQEEVILEQSEVVLDSSEVSSENGERRSRFPKPELEIQFTPLQPNKMSVKEQGCASSVTVKFPRSTRKRKSTEMDQRGMHSGCWKSNPRKKSTPGSCKDNENSENKKNTLKSRIASDISSIFPLPSVNSPVKENKKGPTVQLGRQTSVSSLRSPRKKDGTLQKIGDFLQKSPTILQGKAKKFMETLSSPKNPEVEIPYNSESKPKRSRRKLYKKDISSPMDIASHPIMELDEKESDHAIMKRRLRSRTTKTTK